MKGQVRVWTRMVRSLQRVRYEVSVGLGYQRISMVLNNITFDSSGLWIDVRSPGHEQLIFV